MTHESLGERRDADAHPGDVGWFADAPSRAVMVVGVVCRDEVSTDLVSGSALPASDVVETSAGGVVTIRARFPVATPTVFGRVAVHASRF